MTPPVIAGTQDGESISKGRREMKDLNVVEKSYQHAKEEYAAIGVDTDAALREMDNVRVSLHCWQTDDVGGFERPGAELGGEGSRSRETIPGRRGRLTR